MEFEKWGLNYFAKLILGNAQVGEDALQLLNESDSVAQYDMKN